MLRRRHRVEDIFPAVHKGAQETLHFSAREAQAAPWQPKPRQRKLIPCAHAPRAAPSSPSRRVGCTLHARHIPAQAMLAPPGRSLVPPAPARFGFPSRLRGRRCRTRTSWPRSRSTARWGPALVNCWRPAGRAAGMRQLRRAALAGDPPLVAALRGAARLPAACRTPGGHPCLPCSVLPACLVQGVSSWNFDVAALKAAAAAAREEEERLPPISEFSGEGASLMQAAGVGWGGVGAGEPPWCGCRGLQGSRGSTGCTASVVCCKCAPDQCCPVAPSTVGLLAAACLGCLCPSHTHLPGSLTTAAPVPALHPSRCLQRWASSCSSPPSQQQRQRLWRSTRGRQQ